MQYFVRIAAMMLLTLQYASACAYVFETIDHPQGPGRTQLAGLDGGVVVGAYVDEGGTQRGFYYDGSSFTDLSVPGAKSPTRAWDISGGAIVGDFTDSAGQPRGFIFDGATYQVIDHPMAGLGGATGLTGISGSVVVGNFYTASDGFNGARGFIYDGSIFTTVDSPLAINGTQLWGFADGAALGVYIDEDFAPHGFLYRDGAFTYLNHPLASHGTGTFAIDANRLAGTYYTDYNGSSFTTFGTPHGFVYDGSMYTTIDHPLGSHGTGINGIDGNVISGTYWDASGAHGFLATVPEPSSVLLCGFACMLASSLRRCR